MISAPRQPDVLAQIESRYAELLEGLSELEARVTATLELLLPRKATGPGEHAGDTAAVRPADQNGHEGGEPSRPEPAAIALGPASV